MLVSLLTRESRVYPILNPGAQLLGPPGDGLRSDADGAGRALEAPSQEGDGCAFVHATFKHAFPANASIVYSPLCKVGFMEFGDRLAMALSLADQSRDGLARAIGVSVQAISQAINGVTKAMTAENTLKTARHLRVSPFWLATGQGTPRGLEALRDSLSDEAVKYAAYYDQMSDHEREQFKMLLAVAVEGRKHLGGMSNFGDVAEG